MASLLRSYGLGRWGYVGGKYAGLLASFTAAAGIVILAGAGVGALSGAAVLGLTAMAAAAVYAAWGSFFGGACRSSLSAAGASLAFWFTTMFLYEALGWALFPALPYRVAKPALALFLALDPAEALRLGAVFLGNRGAALGPEFYYWQLFFLSFPGIVLAALLLLFHSALPLSLAARASRRA
jgi:ABC-2 type transport system permease protein/Cu-processing system permease protein